MKGKQVKLTKEMKQDRDYYARCWRVSLKKLLGWSDRKITNKIKGYLEIEHWCLLHERPEHFLACAVIPDSFKEANPGAHLERLAREIERAILRLTVLEFSDSDWRQTRQRVNAILQKHGIDRLRLGKGLEKSRPHL